MTRDELIEQNLGLVHACARRFLDREIEYEELYSAGTLGLIKAAERFDPALGYKFSTYAVPVILGEIKGVFRSSGTVKVSRSVKELSQKAKAISDEYQKEHGRQISLGELAETLGVDAYKASLALCVSAPPLSLSSDDDTSGTIEIPVLCEEERVIEHLALTQAIEQLSDEERELITLRYFSHLTQQKTAEKLSVTQVQVSRKEKKILKKLRAMLL